MLCLSCFQGAGGALIDLDITFFVMVGIFFLTLFILTTLVFNPIVKVLDERRRRIDGAIDESRRLGREADEKRAEFEKKVLAIKREAGEDREALRLEARKAEAEIIEKGREAALGIVEAARRGLEAEVEEARRDLDTEARKLGESLAGRILGASSPGGRP